MRTVHFQFNWTDDMSNIFDLFADNAHLFILRVRPAFMNVVRISST